MPTLKTIEAARGCARTFPFRIRIADGTYQDMTGWTVQVLVRDSAGTLVYGPVDCPVQSGDATTRLVTVEGSATATARRCIDACVEWTDLAGKADAAPFTLWVYPHA